MVALIDTAKAMNQLELTARVKDDNVGAMSVDAQWVANKLSSYGFKMTDLEALYPSAETIATEWAARGDPLISIDLVTGEMRRRYHLKFSNTVRPFLARMLRDRRPALRDKIEVTTTSRGRNRNLKVAMDHFEVVAIIHRTAEGGEERIEIADVPAVAARLKAAEKAKRDKDAADKAEAQEQARAAKAAARESARAAKAAARESAKAGPQGTPKANADAETSAGPEPGPAPETPTPGEDGGS